MDREREIEMDSVLCDMFECMCMCVCVRHVPGCDGQWDVGTWSLSNNPYLQETLAGLGILARHERDTVSSCLGK